MLLLHYNQLVVTRVRRAPIDSAGIENFESFVKQVAILKLRLAVFRNLVCGFVCGLDSLSLDWI